MIDKMTKSPLIEDKLKIYLFYDDQFYSSGANGIYEIGTLHKVFNEIGDKKSLTYKMRFRNIQKRPQFGVLM